MRVSRKLFHGPEVYVIKDRWDELLRRTLSKEFSGSLHNCFRLDTTPR